MESLTSIYGAILQALVTIPALVTFFISFAVQKKIELCMEAFDDLQCKNWDKLTHEASSDLFEAAIELYRRRYEHARTPQRAKCAILTLYGMCAFASVLTLAVVGQNLISGGVLPADLYPFYVIAGFYITVIVLLGALLYDAVSPEGAWIFKLDKPEKVCSAEFLSKNLAIPPRAIIEKIGLIQINGVKDEEEHDYFVEFTNSLLRPQMNYRIRLRSEDQELVLKEDAVDWGITSNFMVKRDKFPAIFERDKKWQIWFEIDGVFPISLNTNTPPFKALIYVFEERPHELPFGVYVLFDLKATAYRMSEERFGNVVIPEGWFWASEEWPHITRGMPSCCLGKPDNKRT